MLLGLDTATEWLHLALVRGDESWTRSHHVLRGETHSTQLIPLINELMSECGATPKDLSGVVVCVGPGGFTSLRTGVATAEGLALTGLPTWGFSAFELRHKALELEGHQGPVWILLDGQRQEAFTQHWDKVPQSAHTLPLSELAAAVKNDAWWAPEAFEAKLQGHLNTPKRALNHEAEAMEKALVELCREKSKGESENPLVPFYLRATDAEVNFPEASQHLSEALRKGHAR